MMANVKSEEGAKCPIEKKERGKRTREGDRALGNTPCRGKGKKRRNTRRGGALRTQNWGERPYTAITKELAACAAITRMKRAKRPLT